MANIVECPECQKRLRLDDDSLGKRLRCPACKSIFVASGTEDEPPEREEPRPRRRLERDSSVQETRPARRSRQDPDDDEEEERPRRPRRSRDDDDADDRRPRSRPKRRRIEYDEDSTYSKTPLVLGILSCCLSCAPIVGIILGRMAMTKADAEIDQLPRSRRFESARSSLRLARTLGIIGMCLSGVMFFVGLALRLATLAR